MTDVKELRKKIKREFGKDDPILETFDRIVGLFSSGKDRISMLVFGYDYNPSHFFSLCQKCFNFLEMRFMLVEDDGCEVEIPKKEVSSWIKDNSIEIRHPISNEILSNVQDLNIWFYQVPEESADL